MCTAGKIIMNPILICSTPFFEFPMYNLKELKLRRVNAFCQDEFFGYLSDAFPNLETLKVS